MNYKIYKITTFKYKKGFTVSNIVLPFSVLVKTEGNLVFVPAFSPFKLGEAVTKEVSFNEFITNPLEFLEVSEKKIDLTIVAFSILDSIVPCDFFVKKAVRVKDLLLQFGVFMETGVFKTLGDKLCGIVNLKPKRYDFKLYDIASIIQEYPHLVDKKFIESYLSVSAEDMSKYIDSLGFLKVPHTHLIRQIKINVILSQITETKKSITELADAFFDDSEMIALKNKLKYPIENISFLF